MILRRFMKHVTDQNWFAVGLDVLVVITGIFLGMQVTDWNEERKEGYARDLTLVKLREDFAVIKGQVDVRVKYHAEVVDDLQYLLQTVRGELDVEPDLDKVRIGLENGEFSWGNPVASATWQALVSSGRQTWIEDDVLRQALVDYHRNLRDAEGAYQELRIAMTEYSRDFKRHYKRNSDFDSFELLGRGALGPGLASFDMNAMKADEDFVKAVEQYMHLQYIFLVNHWNNQQTADEVIAALEAPT